MKTTKRMTMKKYIITTILLLLVSLTTNAQIRVSYNVGYATYKMTEMKEIGEVLLNNRNSYLYMKGNLKQTDNFPSYITHTGEVSYQRKEKEYGIKVNYMTTGAGYALSDYSGKYKMKTVLDAYKIGIIYRNHFYDKTVDKRRISIFFELSPSVVISNLVAEEDFHLYASNIQFKDTEDIVKGDVGYSIQPMFGCRLTFLNHYAVNMNAGYDISFKSNVGMHRIDWSGFRINTGIGYVF